MLMLGWYAPDATEATDMGCCCCCCWGLRAAMFLAAAVVGTGTGRVSGCGRADRKEEAWLMEVAEGEQGEGNPPGDWEAGWWPPDASCMSDELADASSMALTHSAVRLRIVSLTASAVPFLELSIRADRWLVALPSLLSRRLTVTPGGFGCI